MAARWFDVLYSKVAPPASEKYDLSRQSQSKGQMF
jgi:hypothetical protein